MPVQTNAVSSEELDAADRWIPASPSTIRSRGDGLPLDTKTSDGYGTGLVIVIAREMGVPSDDTRLQRGIDWLKSNQRRSGKWFTRSPVKVCGNLISNCGSAFAILALQACGELPGGFLGKLQRETR